VALTRASGGAIQLVPSRALSDFGWLDVSADVHAVTRAMAVAVRAPLAAKSAVARLEQLRLVRESTGGNYGRSFEADDVLRVLVR
jgi:hypothetical protein